MGKGIRTFVVKFKNEISFNEIPLFRGAVLNALGSDVDLLYHNHSGENTFRYSYPLIQYKRIHKKAVIFCVADGVNAIGKFLASQNFSLILGERPISLVIESVSPKRDLIQTWDTEFKYNITNWIPLNSDNYRAYMELEGITEKTQFLERMLVGNLLSFAKGVGIEIKNEIKCKLLSVDTQRSSVVKGVKMITFNAEFKTNLSLPDYIGLGKHVSIGYGTVVKKYNKEQTNN